jgi:hypothetical protein
VLAFVWVFILDGVCACGCLCLRLCRHLLQWLGPRAVFVFVRVPAYVCFLVFVCSSLVVCVSVSSYFSEPLALRVECASACGCVRVRPRRCLRVCACVCVCALSLSVSLSCCVGWVCVCVVACACVRMLCRPCLLVVVSVWAFILGGAQSSYVARGCVL